MPGQMRARSRLGKPRHGDRGGVFAHPARQSFQGHPGAIAPAAEDSRSRGRGPRPRRHQRPGKRQARARSGGGRRTQSAHGRTARRRQIHAGGAAAFDPAAAGACRTPRGLHGGLRRRPDRRRRADQPSPVPRTASLRQHAGARGRRAARTAGRSVARPSRRVVSRRTAGIPAAGARTRCASRWRPARSRSPAPIIASPIRRASCWSRP